MGPGNPGKSWDFTLAFLENDYKPWKVLEACILSGFIALIL